MGYPRLRSNKPFSHHGCTGHQHRARRCTHHRPPSQRGQGTIYAHLHPRPTRSPRRRTGSPYHPWPSVPLPSLRCHHVQCGMHSDLHKNKLLHCLSRPDNHLRTQVHQDRFVDGASSRLQCPSNKPTCLLKCTYTPNCRTNLCHRSQR